MKYTCAIRAYIAYSSRFKDGVYALAFRLQVLEAELATQAEENEKRVNFRAEKRAEKAAEMKQREEEAEAERRRREEALDSLRAQVAVEAEADPLRLLQDTAATRERYGRNLDSK